MQFRKGHGELSVIEAVDNLSNMAELDLSIPEEKAAQEERTEDQISEQMHALSWRDPTYYAYNRERVKDTFRTVLKYMQELYEKDKGQLRDVETQRGIQALMVLAGEAAQKIDKFTDIFKGEKEERASLSSKSSESFSIFTSLRSSNGFKRLWKPRKSGRMNGDQELLKSLRLKEG